MHKQLANSDSLRINLTPALSKGEGGNLTPTLSNQRSFDRREKKGEGAAMCEQPELIDSLRNVSPAGGDREWKNEEKLISESPLSGKAEAKAEVNDKAEAENSLSLGEGWAEVSYLVVFPNPFTREFTAEINLTQAQQATLQLRTIDGRLIYSDTQYYEKGLQRRMLNHDLPEGLYVLSLRGEAINVSTVIINKH